MFSKDILTSKMCLSNNVCRDGHTHKHAWQAKFETFAKQCLSVSQTIEVLLVKHAVCQFGAITQTSALQTFFAYDKQKTFLKNFTNIAKQGLSLWPSA